MTEAVNQVSVNLDAAAELVKVKMLSSAFEITVGKVSVDGTSKLLPLLEPLELEPLLLLFELEPLELEPFELEPLE